MGLNVLILFSGLLLAALDLAAGPYLLFPFFFLGPVAAAAWFRGRRMGIGLSILLPLVRPLYFPESWSAEHGPAVFAANAGIKILVFAAFAEMVHRVSTTLRFRDQVLECLPLGIWVADRSGIIRRTNPAARELWGMDATGESIRETGIILRKLGQDPLIDPYDWAWPRALAEGASTLGEILEITRSDGAIRAVSSSAVPIRMEHGRIGGALLLQTDITEVRRLEEGRERMIRSLEEARRKIRILRGLLPVCPHCRRIRDEEGTWHDMDEYIGRHSEAGFSHGICADCLPRHYPEAAGRDPGPSGPPVPEGPPSTDSTAFP